MIAKDVSSSISAPKAPRRRNAHLSHEQVGTLLATAREPVRPVLAAMAWCGLRIGEVLGFDIADIDWLTATASITKQQATDYANAEVGALPKPEAGIRTVPMPHELVQMCSSMLADRRNRVAGDLPRYLWSSPNGERMQRTTIDSEIRRIRRLTGIEFSAHHLRHYYGAALLSAGVPIAQVAEQMGHASRQVTLRVYAYAMKDDADLGRAAVAAMAQLSVASAPDVHQSAGESA